MSGEKGITLVSVTIYVIVMAIVIGVLAVITTFFYKNTIDIKDIDPVTEYITFNSYFTEEVNHPNIKILECNNNYIVFDTGVQYTFVAENKGIYRNKVKICNGIKQCTFEESIENGKNVVKVKFQAEGQTEKAITYTLKF